jgi:hypothetical protein
MNLFDSFVARRDCVVSLDALQSHPSVKRVICLPREWILYEFYHELLQDPDYLVEGVWEKKMQRFPELRQSRIEMLNQERGLLAPWYAAKKKFGDADGFLVSDICEYRIYSLGTMRWIDFEPSCAWGSAKGLTVTLKTESTSQPGLSQLLREWEASSERRISVSNSTSEADGLHLRIECNDYSGHWLTALWVLLSDGRWKSGVSKMTASLAETT